MTALLKVLAASIAVSAVLTAQAIGSSHATGRSLYEQHCASCHGVNLEGQPNWKDRNPGGRLPAPPHNASGHTWHHSDRALLTIVRDGLQAIAPNYETDMPAFGETLTDEQILAIHEFIKSTWPERERAFQAARQ